MAKHIAELHYHSPFRRIDGGGTKQDVASTWYFDWTSPKVVYCMGNMVKGLPANK